MKEEEAEVSESVRGDGEGRSRIKKTNDDDDPLVLDLVDGHVVDETRDNGPGLGLSNVDGLDVEGVGIGVLGNCEGQKAGRKKRRDGERLVEVARRVPGESKSVPERICPTWRYGEDFC